MSIKMAVAESCVDGAFVALYAAGPVVFTFLFKSTSDGCGDGDDVDSDHDAADGGVCHRFRVSEYNGWTDESSVPGCW